MATFDEKLDEIFKGTLNRKAGPEGKKYWLGDFNKLKEAGVSEEEAYNRIATSIRNSQEATALQADSTIPDWFSFDPDRGTALGHHGHEAGFQASLDPDFVQGFTGDVLNKLYGDEEGRAVGREGSEYWSEQFQDNVTGLLRTGKAKDYKEAADMATAQIRQNIKENPLHNLYSITGSTGYSQPNYIVNEEGEQEQVYLNVDPSSKVGFNPADPNANPFYDQAIADAGGYKNYQWNVAKNTASPGGLEITAVNEQAKNYAGGLQIQTAEQGLHNPFTKAIEDSVSTGNAIKNIDAGSATHGLYINSNPDYKAELAAAAETGDFSNVTPQGVSATSKQTKDGKSVLDPHLNIVSVYDKEGKFAGNNPLLINQLEGATASATKSVSPYEVGDENKFNDDPLINDPFGTLNAINPNTDLTYYDDQGRSTSTYFQTIVPTYTTTNTTNTYGSGGGGGNTTIINEQTQKNKTAEQQKLKENIRGPVAGRNRRYYSADNIRARNTNSNKLPATASNVNQLGIS